MPKSDLPFGSQFTPKQTPLPVLLGILERFEGDKERLLDAVLGAFFGGHASSEEARREVAKNTLLSLIAYGVLDRDYKLTALGHELVSLQGDESRLYESFARHILLNLHGLDVIYAIEDMQRTRYDPVTLESLRKELGRRGVYMPRGGTHVSAMKGWLTLAGVFGQGYQVDRQRVERILGMGLEDTEKLADSTVEQRSFLKALALLSPKEFLFSNRVAEYANRLYGVEFPEKALPQRVLFPLRDAGFIEIERSTEGRGAKPYLVRPADKLREETILPLMQTLEESTGLAMRRLFEKPLVSILDEMASDDRNEKGRALESLAVFLCRLLDLRFVGWRLRSQQTAGAEVDVVVEGERFIFSRWQIQCKNTPKVSLDDVAKEVGLAFHLKSNVVMVVSTGQFSRDARGYANAMMQTTNLNIILLDRADLSLLSNDPTRIVELLDREARHAMDLKRIEV